MESNYTSIADYTVKNILGKGESGTVYLVQKENKLYALKAVSLSKFADQDIKSRMVSEINISKTLNHPNVILFRDVFRTDTDLCILFEYYNYSNLTHYINTTSVSEIEAIVLLKQICQGYQYLYKNKIMHRDLKTDNILLHKENDKIIIKIVDFGLSKLMSGSSMMTEQQAKSFGGTPYFMSPEQLNGVPYNHQCDIYSIGVVYYYMLFRTFPFKEADPLQQYAAIQKGVVKFKISPMKVSKQSIDFIVQCMQYAPDKRIHTRNLLSHAIFNEPYERAPSDYYCNEEVEMKVN